uniref:Kelch-like protein diablo n=1 Tax=Chilo suppressalis TaxID=168631 RepID=A0A7U3SBV9_CHISP|nr:Kelch-like ECH-associated protein 1 [Chilo suppressalis]
MDTDDEMFCGDVLDDMPPGSDATFQGDIGSGSNEIGDMTFCMGNYITDFMKMMFTMRSHHMLTDVVLEVGNELFHVHKVVLAAGSPYFKAMFTSGLKESEMSRVRLQGVCPSAMAWLVYFMYTGKVRITEVTVCQLLPAATMFQIPNVIEACCAFLERQLDPSNAIGIANFAEQHACAELKQKANQFIERHFTQVCKEEEFLQLTLTELIALIRKDELNVREERDGYNAVIAWVKHDEDRRHSRMEHILQAVRCQYLTPRFLKEQMSTCAVLKKVPACREYLAKIFQDLTLHKKPVVKERRPNTPRVIYVSGGYFRHSIAVFEAFNLDDGAWSTLPQLTVPRSGLGAAFLKGFYYAVGGRNTSPGSSYDSDWVDVYNPANELWRPCSPMSTPRHRVGVAVMDGLLYAVGGSSGSEYHKSVECYDPERDTWSSVASMGCARLGVGVAVVNRRLYAVGGFDGARRVASVECYHPEDDKWMARSNMRAARSGAGVAALNQYIYVVGGYDGSQQLSSVERYDTERDIWEPVAPITKARSALSLTVLDNKLYALGGYDGTAFLDIVEVYDPATDTWQPGVPLTSPRSGHAAAVCYTHVAAPDERIPPAPTRLSRRTPHPADQNTRVEDVPTVNNIIGTIAHNANS